LAVGKNDYNFHCNRLISQTCGSRIQTYDNGLTVLCESITYDKLPFVAIGKSRLSVTFIS